MSIFSLDGMRMIAATRTWRIASAVISAVALLAAVPFAISDHMDGNIEFTAAWIAIGVISALNLCVLWSTRRQ
jgi:hypothetical protein